MRILLFHICSTLWPLEGVKFYHHIELDLDILWQLTLLIVSGMPEGYIHTWRQKAQRSKKIICTWSDISYRGKKILQVKSQQLIKAWENIGLLTIFTHTRYVCHYSWQSNIIFSLKLNSLLDADVEGIPQRLELLSLLMEDSSILCCHATPPQIMLLFGSKEKQKRP